MASGIREKGVAMHILIGSLVGLLSIAIVGIFSVIFGEVLKWLLGLVGLAYLIRVFYFKGDW